MDHPDELAEQPPAGALPGPPARLDRASPWPFGGMVAMAAVFFLYAASGLVAPWWGVAGLLAIWLALFVLACRWWTPHPRRVAAVPALALVIFFAVVAAGGAWWGWSA